MRFDGTEINTQLEGLLTAAINSGRLPHTLILEGGSEKDRLALARYLARVHVCSGENAPCDECSDCQKAKKDGHPDIFTVMGELGEKNPLKLGPVRELRSSAFVFPNEARHKVFILHNMQFANEQAQNALLKILEEPPDFVRFIMTVPVSSSLLGTILSRSAVYSLGQQLADSLNAAYPAACEKAARVSAAIVSPTEYELLCEAAAFEKDSELMTLVLSQLRLIFRDAVAKKVDSAAVTVSESAQSASMLARRLTLAQLMRLIDTVAVLERAQAQNANKALLITRFCSLMRKAVDK